MLIVYTGWSKGEVRDVFSPSVVPDPSFCCCQTAWPHFSTPYRRGKPSACNSSFLKLVCFKESLMQNSSLKLRVFEFCLPEICKVKIGINETHIVKQSSLKICQFEAGVSKVCVWQMGVSEYCFLKHGFGEYCASKIGRLQVYWFVMSVELLEIGVPKIWSPVSVSFFLNVFTRSQIREGTQCRSYITATDREIWSFCIFSRRKIRQYLFVILSYSNLVAAYIFGSGISYEAAKQILDRKIVALRICNSQFSKRKYTSFSNWPTFITQHRRGFCKTICMLPHLRDVCLRLSYERSPNNDWQSNCCDQKPSKVSKQGRCVDTGARNIVPLSCGFKNIEIARSLRAQNNKCNRSDPDQSNKPPKKIRKKQKCPLSSFNKSRIRQAQKRLEACVEFVSPIQSAERTNILTDRPFVPIFHPESLCLSTRKQANDKGSSFATRSYFASQVFREML